MNRLSSLNFYRNRLNRLLTLTPGQTVLNYILILGCTRIFKVTPRNDFQIL